MNVFRFMHNTNFVANEILRLFSANGLLDDGGLFFD